jgi:hypothetical protein
MSRLRIALIDAALPPGGEDVRHFPEPDFWTTGSACSAPRRKAPPCDLPLERAAIPSCDVQDLTLHCKPCDRVRTVRKISAH